MSKVGKQNSNASTKSSLMDKVMEKELEAELKKLDLAKRQYEAFYTCEKRKLITRFAHKLMVSTSHDLANKLEKLHKKDEEEANKKKKLSLPAIVPVVKQTKIDTTFESDSYSYMESESSRTASPLIEDYYDEIKVKAKKNVMFSNEVIENFIPSKSNLSDYLYHDHDMNAINTNVIIPKVALVKRDKPTTLPVIEENKKVPIKSTKEFLDSLENENSGFYICTNSKGQPLCDGYDNYGLLLKSNQKKPDQDRDQIEPNVFTNPFETVTPAPATPTLKRSTSNASHLSRSISNLRKSAGSRPTDTSALSVTKNKSKLQHTISFNDSKTRHNSAYLFKQILLVKRKEEEEKICDLQLKAQNIRSLTLKPINIY